MTPIPILQMGDCLLVTIQVDLQDRMAMALQDDPASRIESAVARSVLIDISVLWLLGLATRERALDANP